MINKLQVACFSGHRKLPHDCTELQKSLENAIIGLIDCGVVFFGNGRLSGLTSLQPKRFCG